VLGVALETFISDVQKRRLRITWTAALFDDLIFRTQVHGYLPDQLREYAHRFLELNTQSVLSHSSSRYS